MPQAGSIRETTNQPITELADQLVMLIIIIIIIIIIMNQPLTQIATYRRRKKTITKPAKQPVNK